MDAALSGLAGLPTPFHDLFDGSERIFWLYLLSSALIALALMLASGRTWRIAALRAWATAPDARLDLGYFFVNWAVKTLLIAPLLLSAQGVALWTIRGLSAAIDPPFLAWRYRDIVLAYTLALFLAGDLSRYWLHRLMHRNRWLWLFHRVHHSAEVLTPLLFYRLHPVETALFALRHAVVAGLVTGGFLFAFGGRLDLYTIFGDNLFIVVLFSLSANLRHSPVRLTYGRWLEHVLVSPAQHQIHHDRRHLQSNFGSALAIWDWMFGTLRLPQDLAGQAPAYGLGSRGPRAWDSIAALLLNPVLDLRDRVRRKRP
ncbi:MAG: sterol desaturase family protein [Rhodobacteraceae bacterium]|jgi:sterol desaturase/sphingolipid hydroxylase (fatty acid hydroxylase superfamily)|nr:sterol desaturase family protein [Paracoccaceae bacterium]